MSKETCTTCSKKLYGYVIASEGGLYCSDRCIPEGNDAGEIVDISDFDEDVATIQKIRTVTSSEETYFENVVNGYLKDGWRVSSTSCSCINRENFSFTDRYQAILIKEEEVSC